MHNAQQYDRRHLAVEPTWSEGDSVLLLDDKIRARSEHVLTHKPYEGPYYISKIVQG